MGQCHEKYFAMHEIALKMKEKKEKEKYFSLFQELRPRCGNGLVEQGEECDCGTEEVNTAILSVITSEIMHFVLINSFNP